MKYLLRLKFVAIEDRDLTLQSCYKCHLLPQARCILSAASSLNDRDPALSITQGSMFFDGAAQPGEISPDLAQIAPGCAVEEFLQRARQRLIADVGNPKPI